MLPNMLLQNRKMNCQFLLFQSSWLLFIASSAHGGQLLRSITQQYDYCYEMRQFSIEEPTSSVLDSVLVDNFCMDLQGLTYHFLSSAQGGTESIISVPKAGITVIYLDAITIGFKLDWLSRPTITFTCQFRESSHVLHIYNDIYKFVTLSRQNVTIGRIRRLLLDHTGSEIKYDSTLTQQAGLYTEYYKDMQMIFTLKEENANGDVGNPVFIFIPANEFYMSDAIVNNNVVIHFAGNSYIILTFGDEPAANHFRNSFRSCFDPNITAVPIPPAVLEVLQPTRV